MRTRRLARQDGNTTSPHQQLLDSESPCGRSPDSSTERSFRGSSTDQAKCSARKTVQSYWGDDWMHVLRRLDPSLLPGESSSLDALSKRTWQRWANVAKARISLDQAVRGLQRAVADRLEGRSRVTGTRLSSSTAPVRRDFNFVLGLIQAGDRGMTPAEEPLDEVDRRESSRPGFAAGRAAGRRQKVRQQDRSLSIGAFGELSGRETPIPCRQGDEKTDGHTDVDAPGKKVDNGWRAINDTENPSPAFPHTTTPNDTIRQPLLTSVTTTSARASPGTRTNDERARYWKTVYDGPMDRHPEDNRSQYRTEPPIVHEPVEHPCSPLTTPRIDHATARGVNVIDGINGSSGSPSDAVVTDCAPPSPAQHAAGKLAWDLACARGGR